MRKSVQRLGLTVLASCLALASGVRADEIPEISVTIEKNRFQPDQITIKARTPVVLVITNKDTTVEEFESLDLRIEKIVPAGKTIRVRLPRLKPGAYEFFGDFHPQTAKGQIVVE